MATLRPFYAGDKVSAKQFNELVCAIECLCSQMKNLQRTQRASSFQNVVTQRRYVSRTQTESETFSARTLADSPREVEVVYLDNRHACREFLPFDAVQTPDCTQHYVLGGTVSDGRLLKAFPSVRQQPDAEGRYVQSFWLSVGENCGVFCTTALRNGTKLRGGGEVVHRGSGVIGRDYFYGYGVVDQGDDGTNTVYISDFPFHIYSRGIDVYAGGCKSLSDCIAGNYSRENAIKIAKFCGANIGIPESEAVYFATTGSSGYMSGDGWYARGKIGCARYGCASTVGRPHFCQQVVPYSFCLCADYSVCGWVQITGRFQECATGWSASVPVAYAMANGAACGLVCVRMLEQEIVATPSPLFRQFCARYSINCAGAWGARDLPAVEANGSDPRKVRQQRATAPRCVYWVCLPVAIPENCFGFPTCSLWDWDF